MFARRQVNSKVKTGAGTEEAGSRNREAEKQELRKLEAGTSGSCEKIGNRRSWKQEPKKLRNRNFRKLEAGTSGSRLQQEPEATGS
jgi:hypothetical protein